jgi:hypothetical protein
MDVLHSQGAFSKTFSGKPADPEYRVIQSGKFGEDEFAYLDTESTLGIVFEIDNKAAVTRKGLPPPDKTYP